MRVVLIIFRVHINMTTCAHFMINILIIGNYVYCSCRNFMNSTRPMFAQFCHSYFNKQGESNSIPMIFMNSSQQPQRFLDVLTTLFIV